MLAILLMAASGGVAADLIENFEAHTDQGITEYRLEFSIPIIYLKHFPAEQGKLLKLYLRSAGLETTDPLDYTEYQSVLAPARVPNIAVRYSTARDCFATPSPICVDIEFDQVKHYRIHPGEDGRSILITVLPGAEPQHKSKK